VELGGEFDPKSVIESVFNNTADNVQIEGSVDTDKTGTYTLTYTLGGHSKTAQISVVDTTAPSLELQDVTTDLEAEVDAESFVVSVDDLSKTILTILNPDSIWTQGKAGTTTVKIEAKDEYGNTTVKSAKLTRVADETPPVFAETPADITMQAGETFTPAQLSATDDMDPQISVQTDTTGLDTEHAGTYAVNYTATDRSGNTATYTQNITVVEPDTSKVVYLTFDDGPSENTYKILDILDQYNAKATFFVTGSGQAYNDAIVQAQQKGHTIGLHTYTHNYSQIYASDEAYFADLQQISDMVENLTGVKSTIIRFPGGSSNTISAGYSQGIMSRLTQQVLNKGYQYFDWNVSSSDASTNTADVNTIVSSSTSATTDKLVILFHDSAPKTTTVEALPQIIEHYKKAGYDFKGLDMTSYAAHHGVNN
jgi:peptidoglycan/xylan/chitin deacetylase (PgdA/CDA1 family)